MAWNAALINSSKPGPQHVLFGPETDYSAIYRTSELRGRDKWLRRGDQGNRGRFGRLSRRPASTVFLCAALEFVFICLKIKMLLRSLTHTHTPSPGCSIPNPPPSSHKVLSDFQERQCFSWASCFQTDLEASKTTWRPRGRVCQRVMESRLFAADLHM